MEKDQVGILSSTRTRCNTHQIWRSHIRDTNLCYKRSCRKQHTRAHRTWEKLKLGRTRGIGVRTSMLVNLARGMLQQRWNLKRASVTSIAYTQAVVAWRKLKIEANLTREIKWHSEFDKEFYRLLFTKKEIVKLELLAWKFRIEWFIELRYSWVSLVQKFRRNEAFWYGEEW